MSIFGVMALPILCRYGSEGARIRSCPQFFPEVSEFAGALFHFASLILRSIVSANELVANRGNLSVLHSMALW